MQLPLSKILPLLDPGGTLAQKLRHFEARPEQKKMLQDVLEAYNLGKIALVEAGTGCGKSMAYLIPALLFAAEHKERTVISTHTITLQEQLLHKDIPMLAGALNLSVKAVLVKGMGNYLCQRKLKESLEERLLYPENERKELDELAMQVEHLQEGSRHELKVLPSSTTWERVAAEHDTCTSLQCPHYADCFFFQARKNAQDAQILVVNHHLLFADLSIRAEQTESNISILPAYSRLVMDEAHNIEDIATEYFAKKVSRLGLLKILGRLLAEKGTGKLPILKEKIAKQFTHGFPSEVQALVNRLTIDLPGQRRDILTHVVETFQALNNFLTISSEMDDEVKFRFRSAHTQNPFWKENVLPRIQKTIASLLKLEESLKNLEEDVEALKNTSLNEATKGTRFEILALASRLSDTALILETLSQPTIPENQVRWIELTNWGLQNNTGLVDACLDLSQLFVDHLFKKFRTVILTSATLTTAGKFDFFRERFGLNDAMLKPRVIEKIYPSPFNYEEQALIVIPNDLVPPVHDDFLEHAAKNILDALEASRGGAFILFTSYQMLAACYNLLKPQLEARRFNLFKQGDMSRGHLLNAFKSHERAVLFGTDSFWEGVDVAGEALRAVIIVKLPFKVPTEPIIQARMERLTQQGKDPFTEYNLPQAIVKFKQGFGRLIRGKQDRGAILILDSRVIHKAYGKLFLASLPRCRELIAPSAHIKEALHLFYRQK